MPARVPTLPQTSLVGNVTVGAPVSDNVASGWDNDLVYLLCKQGAQPIISQYISATPVGTGSMRAVYNRTPGVDVIRVDIELNRGSGIGARTYFSVGVSAGTITIIGDGALNGTRALDAGTALIRSPETFNSFFLVTGITPGTPVELIFSWSSIDKAQGPAYVHAVECPLADSNPVLNSGLSPTGEMGLDPSWSMPGNPIVAGSATTKNGLRRVVAQLDRARADVHRHFQIAVPEDTLSAWAVTATIPAAVPLGMHDSDISIRLRPRFLYLSGGLKLYNVYTAHIRYMHSAGNTGNVYYKITPVGGALATFTLLLPNSAGVWATLTKTFLIECTGTNQEADCAFQSDTSFGTQYLALLGGTEFEL